MAGGGVQADSRFSMTRLGILSHSVNSYIVWGTYPRVSDHPKESGGGHLGHWRRKRHSVRPVSELLGLEPPARDYVERKEIPQAHLDPWGTVDTAQTRAPSWPRDSVNMPTSPHVGIFIPTGRKEGKRGREISISDVYVPKEIELKPKTTVEVENHLCTYASQDSKIHTSNEWINVQRDLGKIQRIRP